MNAQNYYRGGSNFWKAEMAKKQVRGLLDYMALEDGEDWEFPPLSENYMFGMGLGASKDAIRWAFKGYMLEMDQNMATFKKKVGRRKKSEYGSIDCIRAMYIWLYVHKINKQADLSLKNRHLIKQMQLLGERDSRIAKIFPPEHTRLQSSVSNGSHGAQIRVLGIERIREKS